MEVRICSRCRQVRPGMTLCPGCNGPLTLADESLFIGETFGKYRIESVLGAGGMGVVYRAIHQKLNRAAAVKIVLPQLADEMFAKRFLREAQVLAELKHPNIVEVYDFDLSDWGMPYYVMECLEGAPLRTLLHAGAGLPLEWLSPVLRDTGAGLAFAHRMGVVHRDLKPDNIFIAVYDGKAVAKLLDFGIAKLLATNEAAGHLTTAGTVMGTPNYLAPEQLLGKAIGPHTDQYALALTVVELLAGKPVRAGKTLGEIIGSALHRPLSVQELPASLPAPLRAALERATQPDPAARFAEICEFISALQLPASEVGARQLAERIQTLVKKIGATTPNRAATPAQFTPTAGLSRVSVSAQQTPTLGMSQNEMGGATGAAPYVQAVPPTGRQGIERDSRIISGRKALMLGALGVAGLSLMLALAWQARRHGLKDAALSVPGKIAPAALTLRKSLQLPPDVTAILGQNKEDGVLLLQGSGAVYLLPPDGTQQATRIPLGADEEILGPLYDGQLWKRAGANLFIFDPVKHEETLWAEKLPPLAPLTGVNAGSRRVISPEGGTLAVVQPGKIEVYGVQDRALRARFAIPWSGARMPVMALGENSLAVMTGKELAAYTLANGQRYWSAPYTELVYTLALLEENNSLAVGGWFDRVDLFDLAKNGAAQAIPRSGETHTLAWLPDHPTLLIGGSKGLAYWRQMDIGGGYSIKGIALEDSGKIIKRFDLPAPIEISSDTPVNEIRYAGGLLAALDPDHHKLMLHDYRSMAEPQRTPLGKVPVWSLAAEGNNLFAGDSDGVLHRVPRAGKPESFTLHGAGITDLLLRGDILASTSDDKTIAVWQLPKMNVVWRSKAHGFLVNQLFLQGTPPSLWSASSDGTIKRWDWPQLEERESLDSKKLLGRKVSLQSLWVSPAGDLALAGSWNHGLLRLEKSGGGWHGELLPVAAAGLYRCAGLEKFGAVIFTGLNPYGAWLYDLHRRTLHRLPSFGLKLYSVAVIPGRDAAVAAGEGGLIRYEFQRDAKGLIGVRAFAKLHTGLGTLVAATESGGKIVAGSEGGELLVVDEIFDGPPLVEETLR